MRASDNSQQNMLTLPVLCDRLSISTSTGRNWVKSGQLVPDGTSSGGSPLFSPRTLEKLMTAVESASDSRLKSRRNKSFVSGSRIYRRYLPLDSPNVPALNALLCAAASCRELSRAAGDMPGGPAQGYEEEFLRVILAEYGLRLLCQALDVDTSHLSGEESWLEALFDRRLNPGGCRRLITDLVYDSPQVRGILHRHPELFSFSFRLIPREDSLGALYLSLKGLGERKALGAYYTPIPLVDRLLDLTGITSEMSEGKILDPSCGTGSFLLRLPDSISRDQICGIDVDPLSAALTRLNLAMRYPTEDPAWLYRQIRTEDYLNSPDNRKFRLILGNPPWGAGYNRDEKIFLASKYRSAGTRPESSNLFVEESLNRLEPGGQLAFVLPESILHVKSHAPIRRVIQEKCSISAVSYLGEAFRDVQCPSVLLLLSHTGEPMETAGIRVEMPERSFMIQTKRPDCFSFLMTDEEYRIAEKIKDPSGKDFLAGHADFALGIVTGDNRHILKKVPEPGTEPVLLGTDISSYRIGPVRNWIRYTPERFQQTAPEKYYRAGEKLVYRFVSRRLMFACDTEGRLTLNSANILIPHIPGTDIRYVLAVLNSRMAQFLYIRDFHSMKVLRSHLEAIPIPQVTREEQERIVRLVRTLIDTEAAGEQSVLYEEIDAWLAEMYGLSETEYQCLREICGPNPVPERLAGTK